MGSSREYWQYARECARWAKETQNNKEDHDLFVDMAKAWTRTLQSLHEKRSRKSRGEGRIHDGPHSRDRLTSPHPRHPGLPS
jgi:hypothetical protein